MTATPISRARAALGVTLRRRDDAARARIRTLLTGEQAEWWRSLTHAELAAGAMATYEQVRAVRREMGLTRPRAAKVTPIGRSLLSGLHPRHVEALRRLAAAYQRGSDMQVRAILAGPEMQQLMTAAKGAGE